MYTQKHAIASNSSVDGVRTTKQMALYLAQEGWQVFPLKPNSKNTYTKKDVAPPLLKGGIHRATRDAAVIEQWFAAEPDINIAMVPRGPVLDIDSGKPEHAETWLEEFVALGELPETFTVVTPSGGFHLHFAGELPGQRKISPAIDVRGAGGYPAAPGSTINGKPYRITKRVPLAPCPEHLLARMSKPGEKADDASTPVAELDTPAAIAYAERVSREAPQAAQGDRNNSLYRLACQMKDQGASAETILEALTEHWCPRCEPPYEDHAEIEKTVASAFATGQKPPGIEAEEFGDETAAVAEILKPETPPKQSDTQAGITATRFRWIEPEAIPPREWLYARHLIRKFLSTTVAPGGIGKSSLCLVEALSIVTGRGLLIEQAPRRGRVWYWNGEDPYDELQRRITAACLHYGIAREDLDGLFVDSGREQPIIIAREAKRGVSISDPDVEAVKRTIRDNRIDVFTVDPFVASHSVAENDNTGIDAVAGKWAEIADATGCAVELVHHVRKTGGAELTAEDSRGASALGNKARSVRVLNVMTRDEGSRAGVGSEYRLHFRIDNGKANLAPPSDVAQWCRMESVSLNNGTSAWPADQVGVVTAWGWPDAFEGLETDALSKVQAVVAGGSWRENMQAGSWVGHAIAEALGFDRQDAMDVARVKGLLRGWLKDGALVIRERLDAKRMPKMFVEVGAPA